MALKYKPLCATLLGVLSAGAFAQESVDGPVKTLGTVTISGGQPTSLPMQIPTTIEGITAQEIEATINSTDSQDAIKYFPSLLVRKRYIGDFDHAVLASRASGVGNSARSLVYADGILISNLLGNGADFAPRWGMVTPEEIAWVDVLYGPFSAAYSGNSAGAVVDFVTRMPTRFEAHAKVSGFNQNYRQYATDEAFSGHQESASVGNKNGDWSWWLNVNHLDSASHPSVFGGIPTVAAVGTGGVPTTGAVAAKNPWNMEQWIVGDMQRIHTLQDHAKVKLAYDFSPTVRATYVLGWWQNDVRRTSESYLRDPAGNPVTMGNVNINGMEYSIPPFVFSPIRQAQEHFSHGLSVKSNTKGVWDWVVTASLVDYGKDLSRIAALPAPMSNAGGPGLLVDMKDTGWHTLALKGTWRPAGAGGPHVVDFGYQMESYKLRTLVSGAMDWLNGSPAMRVSAFKGDTQLQSLYAQDTWQVAPAWKTTLGGRLERWHASNGSVSDTAATLNFGERKETHFSPKAALAWQASPEWVLKTSVGRAVRMPTVSELFQGSVSQGTIVNNDPNLKPEKSWTGEFSVERDLGKGLLRATLFHEDTRDSLYTQRDVTALAPVSTAQNIDRVRSTGLELALQASDVGVRGLDLAGSVTYMNSKIVENRNVPASVGKWQPGVPQWRANFVATYHADDRWSGTLGARYSGIQYGTLDNSEKNRNTFGSVSSFFVTDLRLRYQVSKQWSASFGIDNLNNAKYWAVHPYAQRTFVAELKFDM